MIFENIQFLKKLVKKKSIYELEFDGGVPLIPEKNKIKKHEWDFDEEKILFLKNDEDFNQNNFKIISKIMSEKIQSLLKSASFAYVLLSVHAGIQERENAEMILKNALLASNQNQYVMQSHDVKKEEEKAKNEFDELESKMREYLISASANDDFYNLIIKKDIVGKSKGNNSSVPSNGNGDGDENLELKSTQNTQGIEDDNGNHELIKKDIDDKIKTENFFNNYDLILEEFPESDFGKVWIDDSSENPSVLFQDRNGEIYSEIVYKDEGLILKIKNINTGELEEYHDNESKKKSDNEVLEDYKEYIVNIKNIYDTRFFDNDSIREMY